MRVGIVCPYTWAVPGGVQQHIRDLAEAKHTYALVKRDEVILHLDGWHMGVGGDDGWMASVHPEFLIYPGKYHYAVQLKPVTGHDDLAALGRVRIEGVI